MKKLSLLLTLLFCFLWALTAFAFSPNGSKVTTLNVNSVNQNLAADKKFMVDSSTACNLRLKKNSSVANSGVTQISLRANETVIFNVNKTTPFANLSGCTGSLVRE